MSARLLPSFIPLRLSIDFFPLYKKMSRKNAQLFIVTPQKHGRTVWVDIGGMILPYRLYYQVNGEKEEKYLEINRNAIKGEMLSFPEVGGWAI